MSQPKNSIYPPVSDAAFDLVPEYVTKVLAHFDRIILNRDRMAITGLLMELAHKIESAKCGK